MDFSCQKSDLSKIINIVSRAAAVRTTIPILTGILLNVKDSTLYLEATDMEIRMQCTLPVEVGEEGSIVVPARHFVDLINRLPEDKITISTKNNGSENKEQKNAVYIKYIDSFVRLHGFDVEEYPKVSKEEIKPQFLISSGLLSESVKQVSICESRDESRPVFTGILFDIEDGELLNLVATDSHRLTTKQVRIKLLTDEIKHQQAIIPARVLNEVSRAFSNVDKDIYVGFSENQVFFKYENIYILSQLIDGQFPHYKEVIPGNIGTTVKIPTSSLYEALNRAALLASNETRFNGNIIKFNIKGGFLYLNSHSTDVGEINETLPTEKEGDDVTISFNVRYLIDVLKVLNFEEVKLELTGQLSPALIKPADNSNYVYLLLPIRTE